MTLDQKIESLLPKRWETIKFLSNGDPRCEGFNCALDQCATNLKQAFEEGKICEVPSEQDLDDIIMSCFPHKLHKVYSCRNMVISLLMKGVKE